MRYPTRRQSGIHAAAATLWFAFPLLAGNGNAARELAEPKMRILNAAAQYHNAPPRHIRAAPGSADLAPAAPSKGVFETAPGTATRVISASAVWGASAAWGPSAVWGTSVRVNGTSAVWGASAVWMAQATRGSSAVWGARTLRGAPNTGPNATSIALRGET